VLARALGLLAAGVSVGLYLPILFAGTFQRIFYGITDRNAQGGLFGVSAMDLDTTILVPLSIGAIVTTGTLLPLIRALRLTPAAAMRDIQ
jgi:hypothetical protein